MKTYSLSSFNGGLITSKGNTYAFTCVEFNNGVRTVLKAAEGAKIILVLDGELDLTIGRKKFQLKKGCWMNIPKGRKYGVQVYRTFVSCKFVVLTCLQGSIEDMVISGELDSLPRMKKENGPSFALFGQESEVMLGKYLVFDGDDEIWEDKSINEGFIFALKGKFGVKCFLNNGDVPEGNVAFLPKNKKFKIKSFTKGGKAIVVTSPMEAKPLREYLTYLREEHGILWDDGILKL